MQTLKLIPETKTTADVLVINFDKEQLAAYLKIANELRQQGINVEVYPEAKKLKQQFKYSDRRGFRASIIAGSNELESGQAEETRPFARGSKGQSAPASHSCMG